MGKLRNNKIELNVGFTFKESTETGYTLETKDDFGNPLEFTVEEIIDYIKEIKEDFIISEIIIKAIRRFPKMC